MGRNKVRDARVSLDLSTMPIDVWNVWKLFRRFFYNGRIETYFSRQLKG